MCLQFGDGANRAPVDLDGGDAGGFGVEQGTGEAAWSWADFGDMAAAEIARLPGDAGDEIGVEQEVLAERFACVEAVGADDVTQRRQWFRRVDRSPPGAANRASTVVTQVPGGH